MCIDSGIISIISIDIESLSLQEDATICSLGATEIRLKLGEGSLTSVRGDVFYYSKFKHADQGRHVDPEVVAWWEQRKGSGPYKELFEEDDSEKLSLEQGLIEFKAYLDKSWGDVPEEGRFVLAKDTNFDVFILEHAWRTRGPEGAKDTPLFNFRRYLNFRTFDFLATVLTDYPLDEWYPQNRSTAHNALADATAQGRKIRSFIFELRGRLEE